MKKNRLLSIIMAGVIFTTSVVGIPAFGKAKSKWPEAPKVNLSCASAIVMELSTGQILYKKNMHTKRYPASITKILTAMLTAENCSMNETVTFSKEAVYGIEQGSSTVWSEVGEKMSVEQCLYAIMLESANEVCLAAGEHVSGSISAFVDKMNQRVKELGLKDTHFNNPNGLPDPKHYTSAYDMAVIARQAMKNDVFRKVCNTKRYVCAKTNKHKSERIWQNHHQMINGYQFPKYEYKYCIGGKTGYTNIARNTLVTYASKDGMDLVCVVMKSGSPKNGEPNEYTDTTKLLNYGFENYKKYTVGETIEPTEDGIFDNYGSYFNSEQSPLKLGGEASVVLPKGVKLSEAKQSVSYDKDVKIKDGENVIGHVTYTYDNKVVGSSNIIYTKTDKNDENSLDAASKKIVDSQINELEKKQKEDQKKANILKKIRGVFVSVFGNRIVQIICGILILAIIILLVLKNIKNLHLPKLRKRGRMSGGYRSKRGKRAHARRQRLAKRERKEKKSSYKRNRTRKTETRMKSESKGKSKGVRYHKKHKNTKESFGKNFFDF